MLQIAMSNGRGSNHQRAIGNRLAYRSELFRASQDLCGSHRRSSAFKCHLVGIHYSQMSKAEVAHRPRGSTNV
jgi:hypothetical protein